MSESIKAAREWALKNVRGFDAKVDTTSGKGMIKMLADFADEQTADLRDRLEAAIKLIEQFRQWDHLDNAADGPYWKRTIDQALKSYRRQQRMLNEICVNCGQPESKHGHLGMPDVPICPSFTARPDEGDKLDGQVITDTLEGRALSMALRPIVSKGELADLLVEFATKELAAERTRREEAEAKIELDGKFIAGMIALVKPVLDKDADFRERVQDLAFKHRVMDEYPAQDSSNTSESGADLEANKTKS